MITDRLCGEAVLRGSDVFVRGVQCADAGICAGDQVAVYADLEQLQQQSTLSTSLTTPPPKLSRGLLLQHYTNRTAVFLGVGVAACPRATMFNSASGLAVAMRQTAAGLAIPRILRQHHEAATAAARLFLLPPMNAILGSGSSSGDDFVLQNLPSVTVAHALDPQPGDTILDMCCAPGGKTSHLASRLCLMDRSNDIKNDKNSRNDAAATIIVACDKSRHKMVHARKLFERLGCYGDNTNGPTITPLALDTTQCVLVVGSGERVQTVVEVCVPQCWLIAVLLAAAV